MPVQASSYLDSQVFNAGEEFQTGEEWNFSNYQSENFPEGENCDPFNLWECNVEENFSGFSTRERDAKDSIDEKSDAGSSKTKIFGPENLKPFMSVLREEFCGEKQVDCESTEAGDGSIPQRNSSIQSECMTESCELSIGSESMTKKHQKPSKLLEL